MLVPNKARQRIDLWRETLARQTREHPLRSLAVAVGVGFVLGGGLFSRATARIVAAGLRVGVRMAVVPIMAQSLVALGEGLLAPHESAGASAGRPVDSHSAVNQRRPPHEAQ